MQRRAGTPQGRISRNPGVSAAAGASPAPISRCSEPYNPRQICAGAVFFAPRRAGGQGTGRNRRE